MPKNSCSICLHESREAIDSALLRGERANAVAVQFGVSPFAVGRHKRKHLMPTAEPPAVTDANQISVWLARANSIYEQSAFDQDSRGMVSALSGALKALEAQAKAREREAEQEATALSHDPQQWTEKQAAQFLAYADSVIRAGERLPHCEDQYGLTLAEQHAPDLHEIFLRLQQRPDWMQRVKEFCSTLFAEGHGRDSKFISQQQAN